MTKLGKAYGQSEEHVENLRNVLGTRLGLDEKIMGSWWEHIRNNKNPKKSNTPHPPKEEKKNWVYWVHATIPHWLSSGICIPTCVHDLFWPRLMAGAWIVGTINWVNYGWSEYFSRWFSFAWSDSVIWRRNVKSPTTLQHLQVQPGPSCSCCKVVCRGRMGRGRLEDRSRIYEAESLEQHACSSTTSSLWGITLVSYMRQSAVAADANRSAPRKWLKPNRQEERQRSVVWMSIIHSK